MHGTRGVSTWRTGPEHRLPFPGASAGRGCPGGPAVVPTPGATTPDTEGCHAPEHPDPSRRAGPRRADRRGGAGLRALARRHPPDGPPRRPRRRRAAERLGAGSRRAGARGRHPARRSRCPASRPTRSTSRCTTACSP
jgi:hypothetical protein